MPVILGGNTSIYLASITPPSNPLLLDTYPNATIAYSLRKLSSTYSGSAIRVRRSVDDAEQDIGFVNDVLDTNSLIDFIGYNAWNYSENLAQPSAYTLTNILISTDATVAPDSLNTADKIVENTSLGFHRIHKNATIISGTTYNASVYIKASERTKVQISSALETANNNTAKSCDFDLTTGQITNSTFTTPSPIVTNVGNGWWRFSITQTAIASGTAFGIRISLMNASGSINYTGDGTSGAFAWGFQLSETSDVKTYQKTQADANRNGFVARWYDQSGNGTNAEQNTLVNNQAQIVSNGNLRLDPNNNKVSTQWTSDSYSLTSNITIAQNFLMFAVVNRAATNGVIHPLGSTSASPYIFRWGSTGNIDSQITTGTVNHATADTTTGDYIISALRNSSNVVKAWKNTNALNTGTSTGLAATITRFGLSSITASTGWFQELIYWNTDLESARSVIETDINTYYNIYP